MNELNINDKQFLWVEKFRPQTIDECILPESLKETFKEFIKSGQVPHFLFSGTAGVGKTTIAKALCNEIGAEFLMINGSNEGRKIDDFRDSILGFASTVSLTDSRKVIIIDEADYLNAESVQPFLRGYMEEFSANCRFILTCNFKSKLIEPIHSRCTCVEFKIDSKDKQQIAASFFKRATTILKSENVEFDPKAVAELVTKHFPDYRRILNELQRYSVSGKIDAGILVSATDETFNPLLRMMKEKNFTEVRKWVGTNIDMDSTELFRRLYDKSVEYIEVTSIPQLVLILADYGYKNAFVTDHEINTMACLTEVMSSCSFK
jgi:DNA polymerase III delta prime subunit